ncbi:hydantoinase B/oxoprolinase family protein [Fodinicurvata sp. EGI_FJ10296]|uniref:hydantoinase B/oxoprolinase family protein n=1 Tax=Fodinicurvata sp. EGI_FJ10296 TaxID=3231908 RepID=UPI0034565099
MTDILTLQTSWNRLLAVVEEQARTLLRTAFSPIVREAGDLSAGVFDPKGRMLAQAVTGTPGHVNSMAASVGRHFTRFPPETMRDGDIFITNDPWDGTGHKNDLVVTTPVFRGGKLVALFSCTSHLTDLGGLGFGPDATDVYAEGLGLPIMKLATGGEINEAILDIVAANSRLPEDSVGDVHSLVACNEIGARRLNAMMDEFAIADLDALGDYILTTSRNGVLSAMADLPRGSWSYRMRVDGYDHPIDLAATTTIENDRVCVDFAGTSPEVGRGINVPLTYTAAYTSFGLACALAPHVPNNAGSLAVYETRAPEGSILNARPPAPVALRHVIGQMLPDMVFGCLRQAIPGRLPAEGTSCLWNITLRGVSGDMASADGENFALTVTSNGGTGARPGLDGLSATAFPSGVKGSSVEIMETVAPIVIRRKELRPGSGGTGLTRGGDGQSIEIAHRHGRAMTLLAAFDRIDYPARGADGGADGLPGSVALGSGARLRGKGTQTIPAGDSLAIETPGGGGLGRKSE